MARLVAVNFYNFSQVWLYNDSKYVSSILYIAVCTLMRIIAVQICNFVGKKQPSFLFKEIYSVIFRIFDHLLMVRSI